MKITSRFWRHNKLAAVVCMFGLFWCGVAAVMILLYGQLVQQQGICRVLKFYRYVKHNYSTTYRQGVFNNMYPLFGANSLAKFKQLFFSLNFCFILVEFKHIIEYTEQSMCLKRLKLR